MEILPIICLGWVAGGLVNYLSDVLPWKRRFSLPFCLNCQNKQPFVNYFFWPRRCRICGKPRRWRTWVVELIYIAITLGLWQSPPEKLGLWVGLAWLIYLGVVVVIDMEHRLILHPVSWVGALGGVVTGTWLHGWLDTLIGGVVGYGSMLVLFLLGGLFLKIVRRARGEAVDDVALGFGDVNLGGVLGLLLGWPGIAGGLLLAILLGGAVSLVYLLVMLSLRRYKLFSAIPYGPFLVAAAVILLYFRAFLAGFFQ